VNSCRLAALLVALSGIQTFTGDESATSRVAAAPPFPSVFPVHRGDKAKMLQLISLPPLPDPEGFAGGYLGVTGDHLLFAGGANFPGKKPWEGGTKVWSATVFALPLSALQKDGPNDVWRPIGELPAPLGYGVSATWNDELILAGGSSAEGHTSQVIALRFVAGELQQRSLPPLPEPLANHCGALIGDTLYVFGGQTAPTALATSGGWMLNLADSNPRWTPLPTFPGPSRILAAAAVVQHQLWIAGGASLKADSKQALERHYLSDVWKLDTVQGWVSLPDLPTPSVAAPSPFAQQDNQPLLLGGDDGTQAGQDPTKHRGFSRVTQRFLIAENRWVTGPPFQPAVVTAPTSKTPFGIVIASGEVRPGVRSPAVWLLRE
jgi:N-acetylneuraminate epimerase